MPRGITIYSVVVLVSYTMDDWVVSTYHSFHINLLGIKPLYTSTVPSTVAPTSKSLKRI